MLNLKNNSYCSRNSKNKNMTYGIVGLGRFGSALAMDLASAGAEIVVMDKNEERVRTLREMTEHAYVVANLDKKTLIETGIQNCDVAIVCIAEHLDTIHTDDPQPCLTGYSKSHCQSSNRRAWDYS